MDRHGSRGGSTAGRLLFGVGAAAFALAVLSGCAVQAPGSGLRDADGRPLDPGPPAPSVCATRPFSGPEASCAPVHNPPSRIYVEQAVNTLLPTRAYTSIAHVRCAERTVEPASETDPDRLDAFSHWACVGEEIRGRYLHEDVIWSPASGYLTLNAVTRDLSPELTLPEPNDPGLPNPYLPDESTSPTPSPSGATAGG